MWSVVIRADAQIYITPVLKKEDAASHETESFLSKVYGGSVGLMVASMAGQKGLSKEDIDELYAILREAEKEAGQ